MVEIDFSEDTVKREEAKNIINRLTLEVKPVFVTYLQKAEPIIGIAKEINPQVIQLHNAIELKEIGSIRKALPKVKITKSIPVADSSAVKEAKKYERYVDYILLDTKGEKGRGGTGNTHDWSISSEIVKELKKPIFLAGGLNPDNVEEAIKKVRPFAVDVNSGVKARLRIKDYEKMKLVIEKAKK